MRKRKALVVGVNYYRKIGSLSGCVNDAKKVEKILKNHADDSSSVNFDVRLITSEEESNAIDRKKLKEAVKELFAYDNSVALFYFSGHGHIEETGGYICTSESTCGDDGLPLREIIDFANKSRAQNRIIILDSCYSGALGNTSTGQVSEIANGVIILTASTDNQTALEQDNSGVFTTLLVDALNGSASNLVGDITPGSVYAHIDQSLGAWEQRPVFKANVKEFVSLRKVKPPIPLSELKRICEFFPCPDYEFQLDPSYEPTSDNPNPENTAKFAIFQNYHRVNLLVPVGEQHCYYAAMNSKTLRLTELGKHYHKLVKNNRI